MQELIGLMPVIDELDLKTVQVEKTSDDPNVGQNVLKLKLVTQPPIPRWAR